MNQLVKRAIFLCVPALMVMGVGGIAHSQETDLALQNQFHLTFTDGERLRVEEGVLSVPENRNAAHSRAIETYYVRFPANNPEGAPWFILGGGPGDHFLLSGRGDASSKDWGTLASGWGRFYVDMAAGKRDVIFVNQRGNIGVPFSEQLAFTVDPATQHDKSVLAGTVDTAQAFYENQGVDLRGYDFLNYLDDIDGLRRTLGYEKIVLIGGSFGSQSTLGYIRRYKQHVERAMIDGVEPLAFTYEHPAWVEASLKRIFAMADQSDQLASTRPQQGYWSAIEVIAKRLDKAPIDAQLSSGQSLRIDGHVFMNLLRNSIAFVEAQREAMALAPSIVTATLEGDYGPLSDMAKALETYNEPLIWLLIDNSIGITKNRDQDLKTAAASTLIGETEINHFYRATREITVTTPIDPDFPVFEPIDVPFLMVHGDVDPSTPIEHAYAQLKWLKNGALLRVAGGSHFVMDEIAASSMEGRNLISSFLNAPASELGKIKQLAGNTRIYDIALPALE